MRNLNKKSGGFSLLELLIVVVVLAILALVSIPMYENYVSKARFQNVITVADRYKSMVAMCYGATNTCSPADFPAYVASGEEGKYVSGVTVNQSTGKITVTATPLLGSETYILSPTAIAGNPSGIGAGLAWTLDSSSTCIAAKHC